MEIKAVLSHWNSNGSVAYIENESEIESLQLSCRRTGGKREVCRQASKTLRRLAKAFDLLAEHPDPYKCQTHDEVNELAKRDS